MTTETEQMQRYAKQHAKQKADFLDACKKFLDNPDKYVQGFLFVNTEDGKNMHQIFGWVSPTEIVGFLEFAKDTYLKQK